MSLVKCPECGKEISDKALMCPNCGFSMGGGLCGYEYRSRTEIFRIPLIHIVLGRNINPLTGLPRIAKGIIAIGNIAVGVVSIGGVALGGVCIGGLSIGLAVFGGAAIGLLLAVGGMAVGLVAIGGGAFGYYALGGGAWGVHALGGNRQDPQAIEFFKRYLGSWVEQFKQAGQH
jgi:hypothetical protein